jgi:hypothetical protein
MRIGQALTNKGNMYNASYTPWALKDIWEDLQIQKGWEHQAGNY